MKDKLTKEELERVFSESGTLEDRLRLYPSLLAILDGLPKGKRADFYSLLDKMGVSELTKTIISDFLKSEDLTKRLKIAAKIASARETLKVNTKKYNAKTLREEQELEEALDALYLYGLLLSIREIMSPEEWKTLLDKREEYILKYYPKVLAYNLIKRDREEIRYNFRALEILSKSIFEEAIRGKLSLRAGVDTIERLLEENKIRNFFSEDFLDTLEEARAYIKEAEDYFTGAEAKIEELLKTTPLSEEEKKIVEDILSGDGKKNPKGVYIFFEESMSRVDTGLREYLNILLNMKIKKSDYEKIEKQILS